MLFLHGNSCLLFTIHQYDYVNIHLCNYERCQYSRLQCANLALDWGVATGGGGGAVPPTNYRCPPGAPPQKKNHAYIFFNLPISRVCKYFAPDKYHACALLKYGLKICNWLFLDPHPY